MAFLPIGEGIVPQCTFPTIQIDPPLSGQKAIQDLPQEILLKIFRELPPCTPTTCYKATCRAFAYCYTETRATTIRTAHALLLLDMQTRALTELGFVSSIQTYAEAVALLKDTREYILHENESLPDNLKFKGSADELMTDWDKLKQFLLQVFDYHLEQICMLAQ